MKKPVKYKSFLLTMLCFCILFACASVAVIVLDMRGLLIPAAFLLAAKVLPGSR